MSAATTTREATDAQLRWFNTLAAERGIPTIDRWADGVTKSEASAAINHVKAMPRKRAAAPRERDTPAIPDGRYAVRRTPELSAVPGDDSIVFFKLNTGQRGKWAGFQFMDRISGDRREAVKGALKAAVMRAIAADVQAAAALYGREIGRCGFCHIQLTDDDSRALGIGPECFEKHFGRRRTKADVAEALASTPDPEPAPAARALRDEANRQFVADSARKARRMASRIPDALREGVAAWIIRDGIADDETLTGEDKAALYRQLAQLEAEAGHDPNSVEALMANYGVDHATAQDMAQKRLAYGW